MAFLKMYYCRKYSKDNKVEKEKSITSRLLVTLDVEYNTEVNNEKICISWNRRKSGIFLRSIDRRILNSKITII
jgi:hypothetical protein